MRRRHFITGLAGVGVAAAGLGTAAGPVAAHGRKTALSSWTSVPTPGAGTEATLQAVAAESADLAWAVGEESRTGSTPGRPLALHWDGTAWAKSDISQLGFTGGIRSVSAGGDGNTWAIGTDADGGGHLLAWDGDGWQPTAYPGQDEPGSTVGAVLAASSGEAWVAGTRGEGEAGLMHWDGVGWHWSAPLPAGTTSSLHGLSRSTDGSIWAYGTETVARWDGAWTVIPFAPTPRSGISGLLPVANDDVWLVGWSYGAGGPPGKPPSTVLQRHDGTEWHNQEKPYTVGALTGIVGDPQGAPDRISGWDFWEQDSAHYLRWDAAKETWLSERGPDAGTAVQQNAITAVPGTAGSYWSVGTSAGQPRVERLG